ncbi:MAG: stage IV sporulation protein A [Tenericutes bacterium]|nr:stage IV sporulation protein A [Mycoplasmatota bacterium]
MDKSEVIKSLGKKSNGEIYLGVVGAVRTGKSTFIKKCIETLILPYMEDNDEKKRCMDEIPQTAQGKTIMTVEPKFVPSSGASINIDGLVTNIKLVDCVGYVTPESVGYEDELGNPRMVKTPWFPEEVPFVEAASIGTEKVIRDHATIGIVVSTDGSILGLPRSNYVEAEEKVITELKEINKPFIVIMNSTHPNSPETKTIATALSKKHDVPVIPISVEDMNIDDITSVLKEALYEFPVSHIEFKIPDWVAVLKNTHPLKQKFLNKMKESVVNVDKLRDVENINIDLQDTKEITKAYVSSLNTEEDLVTITLDADDNLFDDILKEVVGSSINSKGELLKVFQDVSEGRSEYESIKGALKQVYQTGYGIVLPRITDMKLDKPEIIKQGGRFGIKLKAKASSVHMIKVDVESSFEPIIGSEVQSKELIDYIMKDEENPEKIWQSEIFGRSLNEIVQEGIQAKLSLLPDAAKYKLSQTITKMVNKGSNNLIAIVL